MFRLSTLCILTSILVGCGGVGSNAQTISNPSASITINEYSLNTGTQLTYNSANATTLAATDEFQYINSSGAASVQNPLEVINAHKAYGYGLTGSGKTIAILDSGFYTSHQELDNKTITTYGTVEAATGLTSGDDHGLFVSSIAAGEDDGSGQQGVAPAASLHIADYDNLNGNTYHPTHWANATDHASSAVVQNNSWGVDYQLDSLQSDITDNSWTNAFALAQQWNSSGYTANEASANSYITALNNFQNHGVIVYALSNNYSYTDADFHAALPELFSQLDEAWIAAVNVEITGPSGNETYTRKSAPCGSSAKYCLGADGFQVDGAAYDSAGNNYYWKNGSGTSFVAPQISGAVALLAEAFPNHTPEQWTDRLLASADNSYFSHAAAVTFGNGVEHGYDTEFGHGIMDIYAALNPITSSSYTRIYTGGSINDKISYQLGTSRLSTSSSLGDSVYKGLVGEIGYTYDDLNGGFEYDMASHIDFSGNKIPSVNLSSELGNLSGALKNTANPSRWKNFNRVISKFSELDNTRAVLTVGASSLPVQSFFNSNLDLLVNLSDYQPPYLNSGEGGIGIGFTHKLSNSRFLVGATVPIEQYTGQTIGSKKSLIAALEYGEPVNQSVTLIGGLTKDKDSLLGSAGTNAFSLSGSSSNTNFIALKAQKQMNDNTSLTGIATLANTNMTNPSNSLVDSASNVKSSSMALIANVRALSGDEYLSLFISQPSRVNSGSMAIRLASLANSHRNINYTMKDVNLEPTGRQIDYGFSYRKDLSKDLRFSAKHMVTTNRNHQQNSKTVYSSYVGVKYKDMKFGLATIPGESAIESEFSYSLSF